jgi:hypothetical protein
MLLMVAVGDLSAALIFAPTPTSGFSDHDIFPAFCEHSSRGIVPGTHVGIDIKHV